MNERSVAAKVVCHAFLLPGACPAAALGFAPIKKEL
jgi:hypothetical protein